ISLILLIGGTKTGEFINLLRRTRIDQGYSSNFLGELSSIFAGVKAAGRMAHKDEWPFHLSLVEQCVQFSNNCFGIARVVSWLASTMRCAIVRADLCDL